MGIKNPRKKATLAVKARQTKWAPVWVVLKKFGAGKRIHPSAITKHKRSWSIGIHHHTQKVYKIRVA